MSDSLIFVHQYFFPEYAGSAQQLTDLTRGLCDRGYQVQVVTGQPSYSVDGRWPKKENVHGVEVHRVRKIQSSRNTALGRILSATSFFLAAFLKLLWMDHRALLVVGSDPPFLPLLGWFFSKFFGQSYILIVSDIYPDIATALGELDSKGWIARTLGASNRLAYARAERIVVLGENMAERLRGKLRGKGNDGKIQVIHNWADGDFIKPIAKSENRFCIKHKLLNRLVVLFSGNLGKIYNFEDVRQAAHALSHDAGVQFLFIGNGPVRKTFEAQVMADALTNIQFLPYQPSEELPFSLTCADLVLISLKKEAADLCVPGKLYYALAAGIPLLVIGPLDSEPAEIVSRYDCGWNISSGDIDSLSRLLAKLAKGPILLKEKSKKARLCFETRFTRQRAIDEYDSLFSQLDGRNLKI